uniref:Uncharacterized protein n=1 Tax=Arcella intermedia TaxID=1963864 RepID=A0A6B2LU49_9EUKA
MHLGVEHFSGNLNLPSSRHILDSDRHLRHLKHIWVTRGLMFETRMTVPRMATNLPMLEDLRPRREEMGS